VSVWDACAGLVMEEAKFTIVFGTDIKVPESFHIDYSLFIARDQADRCPP
jgi:hypothetical protein